jgi:ATP-dependent RNA helicase RhlE
MSTKDTLLTAFSDFALIEPIQRALRSEGYTQPTPIQAQAITPALAGRDILGIAQTGTGKTAAFALPIINRLATTAKPRLPRSCRALILSPTRELASQIAESFRSYGANLKLTTEVIFGGVSINRQINALQRGVDIVVATPGRLIDLVQQKAISLRDIEVLVLDEADQMLDLGFIVPIRRIVPMLPKVRQTLFFSATMPKTIAALADEFLKDPVKVSVAPVATTAERVTQGVMFIHNSKKQALLHAILADKALERVLVFTRTKHGADRVVKHLTMEGLDSAAIHGNKSQAQREKALLAFRKGQCRVLVATDIAARGIDVDGVTHVINFELPNVPESYVHRIGRTARAGAAGIAISFCSSDERPFLRDIERLTRLAVPLLAMPEGFDVHTAQVMVEAPRPPQQPRNGQRPQGAGRNGQRHEGQRNGGGRPGGQSQDRGSQDRGNGERGFPGLPGEPRTGRPRRHRRSGGGGGGGRISAA